jgi:dUTP pyrophosphatase
MKHTNDDDITLFIYINPDYHSLIQFYKQRVELHNNNVNSPYPDSGFDLGLPKDLTITKPTSNKIPLDICCSMYTSKNIPQPYYLYPRSSIIKTPLRLSNSVGIIDTGYRGTITAVVDNLSNINNTGTSDISLNYLERYFQICHPTLRSFKVKIVNSKDELGITERGDGGFGSTGR